MAALGSCQQAHTPQQYRQSQELPPIYPDYADVTIPVNIAPLTMELLDGSADAVVRYAAGGDEIVCGGLKAQPALSDWKRLTAQACGKDITVEVYARRQDGWMRYQPFALHVSPDAIDPYLSYRMISPSYVAYEELTLNQRCLETFDERVMVDNMLCSTEAAGQCVNCHNYQQGNPARMQFHARQNHGGTVIMCDGQAVKVNLKTDSTLSAGVYPSWHPWLRLIAYSTNMTMQSFHTRHPNKIEVLDTESDLIVYDIDRNEVASVESDPHEMEVFPCWAPDGRSLYYCSAHFEYRGDSVDNAETIMRARDIKYNIYRKAFDPDTRRFGPRELVFAADTLGRSATLPRLSPDGRWLLFALGEWGCFHIWHRDADLWLLDLATGEIRAMDELNSAEVESYHSWSSNGRWVVFSSRRNDGTFTRPFFAHVDSDGRATKPFELPSADPDRHRQLLKSYNIPEFMRGSVGTSPQEFADVLKQPARQATYVNQLHPTAHE